MMTTLAKVGFSQSYTYFTWKNTRWELKEFVEQLLDWRDFYRPNFFANTPDILHAYLQEGGRPAFEARLVLAATLGGSYGIYSGFENLENVPVREGSEEYLDSEKYEVKKRALDGELLPLVRRLNELRRANPALQRFGNLTLLETESEHLFAYAKRRGSNAIVAVVNTDPFETREGVAVLPATLGLAPAFQAEELLTGETFTWQTGRNFVRLEPGQSHVLRIAMSEPGQWFESDPLWFKHAVFYEIHMRGVLRRQRRRLRRPARRDRQARLPAVARRRLPLAAAAVPVAAARRRLRHRRLLRTSTRTTARSRTSASSIEAAHQRGIRVIADLVMNHTSSDHPWFQASRTDRDGPYGDWYVWSDTDEPWQEARIIFLDTEPSNWTWDPVRGQYFWHRFFSHQPDLNYDNPEVQQAMLDVLRFWLDLGIDGFRIDAIPYLYERDGTNGENLPESHDYLKRVRAEIDANYPDKVLLAEANQWPEDVVEYFGDGDECHMCFHFPVMPRMFMSLRREDATPIYEILERTPPIPENCQWGLFLRNHDELTLEMVTDEERDYMYTEYAKDPRMKLNLGIRRRLAPLLDNGRDEIELLHAIMFSLPGSPVLYYGDEIGMGDNIFLGDRDGVRTPMQWTGDRNGGFSRADFAQLYLPPLMDPVYGYQAVNVEAQLRTPTSLLRWIRRFIALRKQHPVFGLGTYEPLETSNPRIFAHVRRYEDDIVLCVHNVARSAQAVELDLARFRGHGAGGDVRPNALPAGRRASVSPHARRRAASSGSSCASRRRSRDRAAPPRDVDPGGRAARVRAVAALVRREVARDRALPGRRGAGRAHGGAAARARGRRDPVPSRHARAVPGAARLPARVDRTGSRRSRAGSRTTRSPTRSSRASSSSACAGRRDVAGGEAMVEFRATGDAAGVARAGAADGPRAVEHVARVRRRARAQGLPAHRGRA